MTVVLMSLILGVLIALYFYLTRNYNYWQKRGVPCVDGALPVFGHILSLICMKTTIDDFCSKIYKDNKNHSMIGIYEFTSPSVVILEPELVKQVLQTNFSSFSENTVKINSEVDLLVSYNPFLISGEKWLNSRKRLIHAFSSMRLKILLESIKQVCTTFEKYIDEKMSNIEKAEFELKSLFARYAAQVVAVVGFGVDGHCFNDTRKDMSFRILEQMFDPSIRNRSIFLLMSFNPSLNKILKQTLTPKRIDHFFRTLVADLIEQRKKNGIPRNNIFHFITEQDWAEGEKFNIEMLAGLAMSFIIDVYETASTVMSIIGFHLASYPKIQEKLREEVISVLNRYNGEITYEGLSEMTYMDQVLNESLRMTSAAAVMRKRCTEEFELKGSDGVVCRVQPGMNILIPVQSFQKDPQYWENPEEYNPERFNLDRKHSIEKFTFLPFGEGPRICVGMRMGQLQVKAGLAIVLKKYIMELSPTTQIPLKLFPGTILPTFKNGLWVYLKHL